MTSKFRCAAMALGLVLLSACGGGGGGGGDGLHVTWSPTRITAAYMVGDTPPSIELTVKLSSVPTQSVWVVLEDGGSVFGNQELDAHTTDDGHTWVGSIQPKAGLTAATYSGSLKLRLCTDGACNGELGLSGNVLGYTVTVTATPACVVNSQLFNQGAYAVENNAYANAGLTHPVTGFQQCVYVSAGTGAAVDARWTWSWPTFDPNLHSYPEVEYGQKPWMNAPTAGAALPKKLSDIGSVTVHLDRSEVALSAGFTGYQNFDLYLATDTEIPSGGSHLPVNGWIQVFLKSYGGQSWALPFTRSNVAVAGCHWDTIYQATSGDGWPIIAYFPRSDCALSGVLDFDLAPFIADYRAHEGSAIASTEYLTSVEFGTQIFQGSGELDLNDFQVTVAAPAP